MICPRCGDEFEDGITRCPDDDVALVPTGTPPPAPDAAALLGTFHPAVAALLVGTLERRHMPHDRFDFDDRVELLVTDDARADLRAELVTGWSEVLGRLPEEERLEVRSLGGTSPGWFDAPAGAWVDRDGRLRVSEAPGDEHLQDAERTIGPGLAVAGAAGMILAWYGGGDLAVLLGLGGLAALVVGLLLPR